MLSACILCSSPIGRLTLVTIIGSIVAPAISPAILSMVRAVRAPSFFTCSSYASRRTPDTTQMLVMSVENSKAAALWFFMAQSRISFSIMLPTSMGSPLTIAYNSTSLSCEIVVVWVVGVSLNFRTFTYTLTMGFQSILLITCPSSLAHDVPSTVSILKIVFHLYGVNLSSNLAYSQLISVGKL